MTSSKKFRLAVVGSRTCESPHLIPIWLNKFLASHHNNLIIVSGGAKGVDTLATDWAKAHNVPTDIYLPNWSSQGPSAGFIRNHAIWGNADMGIAFWDGFSRGTAHSFTLANKHAKPLIIVLTHKQSIGGMSS